jgi:hypothetical protein
MASLLINLDRIVDHVPIHRENQRKYPVLTKKIARDAPEGFYLRAYT